MSNKALAVVIGRFMLPHLGHRHLIHEAAKQADNVIIMLGSSNSPRTTKNPFTFEERRSMLSAMLEPPEAMSYRPLPDEHSNDDWAANLARHVVEWFEGRGETYSHDKVVLVGHTKDASSWYLSYFPQWEYQEVTPYLDGANDRTVDATHMRETYFSSVQEWGNAALFPVRMDYVAHLHDRVRSWLYDFEKTPHFAYVQAEKAYEGREKAKFAPYPYKGALNICCADNVVICQGHVLVIRRRNAPGKDLWALPGGHKNSDETFRQCAIRELKEETRIKLPKAVLDRAIVAERVFDNPNRSTRGPILTMAFLIILHQHELPEVRGDDDAVEGPEGAQWLTIEEFRRRRAETFEDHNFIFETMLGLNPQPLPPVSLPR